MFKLFNVSILMVAALAGCAKQEDVADNSVDKSSSKNVSVNTELQRAAEKDADNWLGYGRTLNEQRFVPATEINRNNVGKLGLAWFADLDTARGQEATPLVIDGQIFTSTAWSKVKAYNAVTGEQLWDFDPQVPREVLVKACCDAVSRGVAAWDDAVFVATLDGRLIALDRSNGKQRWSVQTFDASKPYSITGAPRVVNGKVLIGNSGAEMGPVRGYVTAYDAKTGEQLWRFYTVPDNPANGEQPAYLEAAAKTWTGEWWKFGGGGTAWDSMAYDADLNLLYIGVGNGAPWNPAYRSPEGGDNLYLSSIVAVNPDTGDYVWHYQTTPGDAWDYTATQSIILADLELDGQLRKVLMQAPKNGFFYVLDRATGELLSANNYVPVNWATGIDMQTGRPKEVPSARYYKTGKPVLMLPAATGGHNWHPMAYSPEEQLAYIPAMMAAAPFEHQDGWESAPFGFNVGVKMESDMPSDPAAIAAIKASIGGALVAWDPATQSERWRVEYPGPWNGGVLTTAGGLVFQGDAAGYLHAYNSATGEELWSFFAQTGIVAAPMSFTVAGEQYVAVLAGWGGLWSLGTGPLNDVSGPTQNISRLLVFKLEGNATLPPVAPANKRVLDPPAFVGTAAQVKQGGDLYGRYCFMCHGANAVSGGITPDLRYSAMNSAAEIWKTIVHDGALAPRGMVSFAAAMTPDEIESIRQFVIKRANDDLKYMQ